MKKILLILSIVSTVFFVFTQRVYAGCSGGTWEGYDKKPLVCDEGCVGPGDPFEWCKCTGGNCDTSYVKAGEPPCSSNSEASQCTTPVWECNNGVVCTWTDPPTNTPVPPPPTNTPVPPPTSTPPPGCTRTCNYNVGPCGGSFPTGGSCAPDSKPAWQDCTCPDEIIDQVCLSDPGCVGAPTSTPTPTNTPTPIPFYTIGGKIVNPWLAPLANVPVQIPNSTIPETITVTTNASGNFTSPDNWARRDDGYAVRPEWNLIDPKQAPACYAPPALTTKTNPPSTPLNNISYEFQSAGNFDCGTSCDFKYNCKNPGPIRNLRPSGTIPTGSVTFMWDPPEDSCASHYMFRLDDKANGWSGDCTAVNPGDSCVNYLTATSYTYDNIQAGHAYSVWVDSFNFGCWGPSVGVDVSGACGTPQTPSITSPLNNSCYKSDLDMAFDIRQSDTVSSCYPHDASGGIFIGASTVKTSLYGANTDVLGSSGSTYTFTQWNPPAALNHGTYDFYSRTRNKQDIESNLASRSFGIDRLPPDKPAAPVIMQNGDRTLTVSWNGVNDVGCGGLGFNPYWSQLSTNDTFSSVVSGWFNSWEPGLFQTSTWKCPNNKTVYAHVQARDIFDWQSGWSLTSSYTCTDSSLSCSNPAIAPSSPQKPGTALTFDANVSGAVASCSLYAKTGEYPALVPVNFKTSVSESGNHCTLSWTPTTGMGDSDLWYSVLSLNGGGQQANCDSKIYCLDGLAPPKPSGEELSCSYDAAAGKYYAAYLWNLSSDSGCGGLHSWPYWAQIWAGGVEYYNAVWGDQDTAVGPVEVAEGVTVSAHVRARDVLDNQSDWTAGASKLINAANCFGPAPTPTTTATPTPRPPDPACLGTCEITNVQATDNLADSVTVTWDAEVIGGLFHFDVGHDNFGYGSWWDAGTQAFGGSHSESEPNAIQPNPLPECITQNYVVNCYSGAAHVVGETGWCGGSSDIGGTFCPAPPPPTNTPTPTATPTPFQNYYCPI